MANSRGTFGYMAKNQVTATLPLPAAPLVVDLSTNTTYAQLHVETFAEYVYAYGDTQVEAETRIGAAATRFKKHAGEVAFPIIGNTGFFAFGSNTGSAVAEGISYELIYDTDGGW
jgi:hypothetical protein